MNLTIANSNRELASPAPLFMGSPVILKDIKNLTDKPYVCLTFDDGPDPVFTPRILDILAEHNICATFFVLGEAAKYYPALIERMVEAGHTIANHSFGHRHSWMISSGQARQEISQASKIITQIAGAPPRWFRPPYGRLCKAMVEQCSVENMAVVLWNHSIIDWGPLGTESGIARRLGKIRRADIVLMHDGERRHNHPGVTAKKLPAAIENLKRDGMLPVALDQLISQ